MSLKSTRFLITQLKTAISQLLKERQEHEDAIAHIDAVFKQAGIEPGYVLIEYKSEPSRAKRHRRVRTKIRLHKMGGPGRRVRRKTVPLSARSKSSIRQVRPVEPIPPVPPRR